MWWIDTEYGCFSDSVVKDTMVFSALHLDLIDREIGGLAGEDRSQIERAKYTNCPQEKTLHSPNVCNFSWGIGVTV